MEQQLISNKYAVKEQLAWKTFFNDIINNIISQPVEIHIPGKKVEIDTAKLYDFETTFYDNGYSFDHMLVFDTRSQHIGVCKVNLVPNDPNTLKHIIMKLNKHTNKFDFIDYQYTKNTNGTYNHQFNQFQLSDQYLSDEYILHYHSENPNQDTEEIINYYNQAMQSHNSQNTPAEPGCE